MSISLTQFNERLLNHCAAAMSRRTLLCDTHQIYHSTPFSNHTQEGRKTVQKVLGEKLGFQF